MDVIPTAELHLHVEGALDPELLARFARRNGIAVPDLDPGRYVYADLQQFLDLRDSDLAVMRTEQDFFELAEHYLAQARAAGVVRAESFIDPMVHLQRGVPIEAVMDGFGAAFAAARADGLSCDLIVCFTRDLGADAAQATLDAVPPFRDRFIGVGLDSAEVGWPPALFADIYARAASEGLRLVAHAGEEGGPDYVREALDALHVERVDHGLRAMEDPDLVARIADEQVALTVCPLSNVALRAVPDMAAHPVFAMLEQGVRVTVSSDDPAYFGGGVDENHAALRRAGATEEQLVALARNSFDAAFVDDAERARLHAALDAARRG
ncbi:adenosine deaminase [Amnibacterium endophyticum]|uniref:Adenine deaminase n=1 Tax=Amnibacterium endophyticum TaxID=2109337 RepID=A0ABW4LEZ4_9MICO